MSMDDYLLISGLQHFAFCRRQWALIHIEQQWSENVLTAEGQVIHKRVHDIQTVDIRGGIITMRNLPVKSDELSITGCCDAVEFIPSMNGITLNGYSGMWQICPVEYKHGKKKIDDCDRLQVVAQALCLEEMFFCEIPEGAIFYHETRKRERFIISDELRKKVKSSFEEMHDLFNRGYTPVVRRHSGCNSCSLKDICLSGLFKDKRYSSVDEYIRYNSEVEI